MAASSELLNTTYSDIEHDLVIAQEKRIPLFDRIRAKGSVNKSSVGGTYFEHVFVGQAPGTATAIYTGSEIADGTRTPITFKFSVESHRFIAPITIPNIELEKNSGTKQGVIDLIKAYPEATMKSIYRDINKWLLAASTTSTLKLFTPAQLDGLATFNGQFLGTKRLGATQGLLSFKTPATQTEVTQNVAKSTTYEWYNQYQNIASWAAEGMERVTQAYMDAAEFSDMGDGADLGMADPDSFSNLLTSSADTVRISDTDKAVYGKNVGRTMFFNSVIYRDTDMARSNFTGVAANGVIYFLNTDDFKLDYLKMPTCGKFAAFSPYQDAVASTVEGSFNLVMRRGNSQACVTGAANV